MSETWREHGERCFDIIQNKSKQYGISYKELIERLVKNFAIGNVAL